MKCMIRRYACFLLLLGVLLFFLLFFPEVGKRSLSNIGNNIFEMLAVLPPVFILLGLLDVWVDRQIMIKYTGPDSGLKGILISFFIGSAAAGPLYVAFPVASAMLYKGSSLFNVCIFIGAWATTKIPLLTFEASSLGFAFMLVRLCLSIAGIILTAFVMDKLLPEEEKEHIYLINGGQS